MKVLKFGGTSIGDEAAIRKSCNIMIANDYPLVVVVSAIGETTDKLYQVALMAKTGELDYLSILDEIQTTHLNLSKVLTADKSTDQLIDLFEQLRRVLEGVCLLRELTDRSLDFILSTGELLSSTIITTFLTEEGHKAKWNDSRKFIMTDHTFGNANVIHDETEKRLKTAQQNFMDINLFPGFIAGTEEGEVTTLGRGGSDFTASIIAAALNADLLEIWTDVNGIMTADPRRVKRSHTLDQVSYEEALELSHFGAKVIYAQSILPIYKKGISMHVKNTFLPDEAGTLVTKELKNGNLIKGISSIDDISLMTVSGNDTRSNTDFFPRLFKVLADHEVEIVFMTHSNAEFTVTLGFKAREAKRALKVLKKEFKNQDESRVIHPSVLEEGYSLLALIGSNMKDQVGVSGNMFNVLGKNGISIKAISQGSSERNISAIILKEDLNKALNVLHENFFLSQMRRVNLFIIGTGNVGKAFLDQVTSQFSYLKEHHHLNIKAIGVANSRQMIFEKDGIPLSKWSKYLEKGEKFSEDGFVKKMSALNYRNSIFIDITASEDIAQLYSEILKESISVVTPNKIAATRSYQDYLNLKATAKKYRSQFLIETNVCAGLPVLSTLSDLVRSGDKVLRMEAVLSGTLNFLFNEYDGSRPFSQVIKKAKELGYTEPDPRLDISGEDVMRKLLILVRESGYSMEMEEINSTSFLPASCEGTSSLEEFYGKIEQEEVHFKNLYQKAIDNGTRLKVVASYENGVGNVSLKEVADSHPFYNLEGKDNVVLFYTNRYSEQPLVIKGAGAGSEVTASGIFADVLRIAQADY